MASYSSIVEQRDVCSYPPAIEVSRGRYRHMFPTAGRRTTNAATHASHASRSAQGMQFDPYFHGSVEHQWHAASGMSFAPPAPSYGGGMMPPSHTGGGLAHPRALASMGGGGGGGGGGSVGMEAGGYYAPAAYSHVDAALDDRYWSSPARPDVMHMHAAAAQQHMHHARMAAAHSKAAGMLAAGARGGASGGMPPGASLSMSDALAAMRGGSAGGPMPLPAAGGSVSGGMPPSQQQQQQQSQSQSQARVSGASGERGGAGGPRILSRYKTKLCSYFMDSDGAFCPHGASCQFAHGVAELRVPGPPGSASVPAPLEVIASAAATLNQRAAAPASLGVAPGPSGVHTYPSPTLQGLAPMPASAYGVSSGVDSLPLGSSSAFPAPGSGHVSPVHAATATSGGLLPPQGTSAGGMLDLSSLSSALSSMYTSGSTDGAGAMAFGAPGSSPTDASGLGAFSASMLTASLSTLPSASDALPSLLTSHSTGSASPAPSPAYLLPSGLFGASTPAFGSSVPM